MVENLKDGPMAFRILWLILLVIGSILLVKQVSTKVEEFRRNPIRTNIDMEYPTKMTLPAIAICNTNQFRS